MEKKYIEAEQIPFINWGSEKIAFKGIVDSIPAADAQEVRHGTWVRVDPTSTVVTWRCSECRFYAHMKDTNYCPACGAKMDGGEKE